MNRARGAALVMVLWLVALLTALVGAYALSGRVEHIQGRAIARGVVAEQSARAGLEYAMDRLADADPQLQWIADGRPYRFPFAGAEVVVRAIDESGKVDLNAAEQPLLVALLQAAAGMEGADAAQVAGAIVDWRDGDTLSQPGGGAEDGDYASAERPYGAKDAPFETIGEVEQVLGMTPEVFAAIEPFLTIYSGLPQPDQRFAAGPVLQALGVDPTQLLAQRESGATPVDATLVGSGSGTYSVESRARLSDGRIAVLRAVVRVGASSVPGSAYTPLRWEEGATPR